MIENKFCILLADDEILMTKALKDFFTAKGFYVHAANDGQKALELYYSNNEKIDLIILDIMMPHIDGITVLKEIRSQEDNIPIIMLTAKSEEYDQISGFHEGADDYVTKPFSPTVLLARVNSILKRTNKLNLNSLTVGKININLANHSVNVNEKTIDVTRREFDLLHYLIINKEIALSREQLLTNVWGYDFEGDSRTVDTHIKQLRMKLADASDYIRTIHRIGYMFAIKENGQ
ncbi:MAG: response regulator transcription factor [Clostridia bacterium]